MSTILPSGEEVSITPDQILRYVNPDGVRQLVRQQMLMFQVKTDSEVSYIDKQRLFKYTGEMVNKGLYQKTELRTYPDNGAYEGYAGLYNDTGILGVAHNADKWDKAMSDESKRTVVNRTMLTASAKVDEKSGYGLGDDGEMTTDTNNRMTGVVMDPYDGRTYLLSNDDPSYVNNEVRQLDERLPDRTVARIGDVPTRLSQLHNDIQIVADPDYRHTDNNYSTSNRFVLDNLDDRTLVTPELSKDERGNPIENRRIGLSGNSVYAESDGDVRFNTQPDLGDNPELGDYGDRQGEEISSYNHNKNYSGASHPSGYLPGIFRSIEELERVDLVDQRKLRRIHKSSPGGMRDYPYYNFDGEWSSTWYNGDDVNESFMTQSPNPNNTEVWSGSTQPIPYNKLPQANETPYDTVELYQWRYNRVDIYYCSDDIVMEISDSGIQYKPGDVLRWSFGDDSFTYVVDDVGVNGQILTGHYQAGEVRYFDQNPSTFGVGVSFTNSSSVGHGARISISCKATIKTFATQIKNNLYALVDITPTVRSDNNTEWSDVHMPDTMNGKVAIRSTAAGPAYSGINSGRGGPSNEGNISNHVFYEHGGNPTAGVHVHLFRYIIDTEHPSWVERDGIKVYLGRWVDQGPLGLERPCDIKALLFSNPDCNNFNNFYKFNLDMLLDKQYQSGDENLTNNANAISGIWQHRSDHDPDRNQKFTSSFYNEKEGVFQDKDITDKVIWINEATGVMFYYNSMDKNDPKFGYGYRKAGWHPIAGAITR